MGRDNGDPNAPMNTLKPQPGQYDSYHPKFHPLPGEWAQEQLKNGMHTTSLKQHRGENHISTQTEIQKALAEEKKQHDYWEKWQGVTPGKPVYEDPRAFQNTLLPVSKYGTDGRGD